MESIPKNRLMQQQHPYKIKEQIRRALLLTHFRDLRYDIAIEVGRNHHIKNSGHRDGLGPI